MRFEAEFPQLLCFIFDSLYAFKAKFPDQKVYQLMESNEEERMFNRWEILY